jgi:SAM-dependent methyltransferase
MSSHRTQSFRRMGAAFQVGGDRYERLRPGYPAEAVDWLVAGVPVAGVAVDVGAGTGKLTGALLAHGLSVVAVDPSPDMLAQVSRLWPGATPQVGTGEATGLPDQTADLVTFAQSWHWVEPIAGSVETARILTPGGRAGWVWNFLDVREPWVAQLAAIWHTVAGEEAIDAIRQAPVLGAPFGPLESITIDWTQPMPLDDLAELVMTRSYYLNATQSERRQVLTDAAAFVARQFPGGRTVDLPYRTHCFRSTVATADV